MGDKWTLVIFDVDGTLVMTFSGEKFRKTADDWLYIPGRMRKIEQLHQEGVKIGIASNQGGVAFSWSKFTEAEIQTEIERVATDIYAEYVGVCYTIPKENALPHYRNFNDPRRKPGPGMLLEAMQHYGIGPEETLFVGDRPEDEEAARAAGVSFQYADDFFAV